MTKFNMKRIIGLFMAILLIATSMETAFATSNEVAKIGNDKTNFNFISINDLNHIEYTYDENGISYKVIESANEKITEVNTRIFQKVEGEYVLISDYKTMLENNNDFFKITTIKDGNIQVDRIKKDEIFVPLEKENMELSYESSQKVMFSASTAKEYTDWIDYGTTTGSSKITQYTLTIVIGIISGVAGFYVAGAYGAGIVSAVSGLAGKIVDDLIPTVYYKKYWYNKFEIIDGSILYLPKAGEKTYTYFYSDKERTKSLGKPIQAQWIAE